MVGYKQPRTDPTYLLVGAGGYQVVHGARENIALLISEARAVNLPINNITANIPDEIFEQVRENNDGPARKIVRLDSSILEKVLKEVV